MEIKEVKEICKLIPKFIMMCENDFGEVEPAHKISGEKLNYKDVQKIKDLMRKLNNCINFVDNDIFE